jgi:phage repressor protein C with HTH and peptisase S24 domain
MNALFCITMNWQEFINDIMRARRISEMQLAQLSGITQPTIHRLRRGETERPNQTTIRLLEESLNIKIEDSDPDDIKYEPNPMTQERFDKLLQDGLKLQDALLVREYPLLATVYAGEPAMLEHVHYDEKAVFAYDKQDHTCFALRVSGKSMETTLRDGDIVLVDISIPITDGCLVVVKLRDGSQLIKRYHNLDEVYIKLTSDNHEYGVRLVKKEDIQVCYRVVSINFFL